MDAPLVQYFRLRHSPGALCAPFFEWPGAQFEGVSRAKRLAAGLRDERASTAFERLRQHLATPHSSPGVTPVFWDVFRKFRVERKAPALFVMLLSLLLLSCHCLLTNRFWGVGQHKNAARSPRDVRDCCVYQSVLLANTDSKARHNTGNLILEKRARKRLVSLEQCVSQSIASLCFHGA